jgi:hypothetical protein
MTDAMPAGKELDELIARHVFNQEYERGYAIPDYSTDISAALEVLLLEKFIVNTVKIWRGTKTAKYWRCSLAHGGVSVIADAPTMQLAICRAALKAVMP